jgi:pimeloyl-ACP methyl ester carboxylesterase
MNSRESSVPVKLWARRIATAVLVIVLVLMLSGFVYENVAESRDRRFNPMPGKLLNVDGIKMHIDCLGEGNPTVILDSGLGDSYVSWRKVQPEIAKTTRVCSYDRAGIGYSETSPRPRTSSVIASELHDLLSKAAISPPYVLVGHSMAGYDVRVFANLYRDEVAGMLLVDASHPEQDRRFPAEIRNMEGSWQREAEFLAMIMPFGIPRLIGFCDEEPVQRAADCNYHSAREGLAEMKAFPISAAETARTGTLGDLPLAVLSHDPDKPSGEFPPALAKSVNTEWEKMQEDLAHLSSRGTQTIAKNSAHYIQIDRPDLVISGVQNVIEQARANVVARNQESH